MKSSSINSQKMTQELIARVLERTAICLPRRRFVRQLNMGISSVFAAITVCVTSSHLSNAQQPVAAQAPSPLPTSVSPDKKWEYKPASEDRKPQIVKAGTDEAAGDLACDISTCGGGAKVFWAPDSKRLAFHWGQGRTNQTTFYQLRNNHWEKLQSSPGDEASERVEKEVEAQLKRNKVSEKNLEKKGLYLRLIWETDELDRWLDANTALLYAGLRKIIAKRDDPGEMSDGYGADILFTIKFDDRGKWKIVKAHRMSEKEVEKRDKGQ